MLDAFLNVVIICGAFLVDAGKAAVLFALARWLCRKGGPK